MLRYTDELIKTLDSLVSSFSPTTRFRIITFNEKVNLFKDGENLKIAERLFNKNDHLVKEYYKKQYQPENLSLRTYLNNQLYVAFQQSKNDQFAADDKFYILLSDGEDNASDKTTDEALAQYKNGKVYIIDFNLERQKNPFLENVVAKPLHAEYYKAEDAAQLASYFKSIGEKIIFSGYEVTFEPNIPPAFVNTNVFEFKNNQFLNIDRLKIEEVKAKELFPLLNYIFFDENSSEIPVRYNLLNKAETADFDEQKLQPDQLYIYHNLLNIVGKRMQGTSSKLTLYGCNSDDGLEKNNLSLSKNRVESVKSYLVNVWGIEPERIEISVRNLPEKYSTRNLIEGKFENKRVEMFSNDPKVFDLVELNHRTYLVNPNAIQVKPHLQSKNKIVNWAFTVKQDNNNLYEKKSSEAIPELLSLNLLQNLDFKKLGKSDLMLELTAIDERGNKAVPYAKRIPVDFIPSTEKQIEKVSLVLFDFNSSALGKKNQLVLDHIKDAFAVTKGIDIKGYTDIIGTDEYNLKLSTQRAKSLNKTLVDSFGLKIPISVEGLGELSPLYDNQIPEGRFYNRTCQMVIEF